MKKILYTFFVFSLLLNVSFVPVSAQTGILCPPLIKHDLFVGVVDAETGGDVFKLHDFLKKQGYSSGDEEGTGFFEEDTEKAVKDFQSANSISPVSGYVGPITTAKINSMNCGKTSDGFTSIPSGAFSCPPPIKHELYMGVTDANTGGDVFKLHDFLKAQGYSSGNEDGTGIFGSATEKAVKDFQSAYGIRSTGYVGTITLAQIKTIGCQTGSEPSSSTCPLINNDLYRRITDNETNGEVSKLQTFLLTQGFSPIREGSVLQVTGYFGPATQNVVYDFQTANGIPNTGYVGVLTKAKINEISCAITTN